MEVDSLIKQLEDHVKDDSNDEFSRDSAQQIADELTALKSIFGEGSITLLASQQESKDVSDKLSISNTIRLCVVVPLSTDESALGDANPNVKLSAILPIGYPNCDKAPQLQLLNRYIGSHGVDHGIFGEITRLYHHQEGRDNVIFTPGQVALFDGIEKAREKVEQWYQEQEANVIVKKNDDSTHHVTAISINEVPPAADANEKVDRNDSSVAKKGKVPTITSSAPIMERKSTFVGHAAILEDVSQVSIILDQILKDKKVARATHPIIHAWMCKSKGDSVIYRDCEDDGETAAGGRLAHLLDLLQLENVIIVVTRWYGGVRLGPDRFKLINRAARDALEMANLVPGSLNSK